MESYSTCLGLCVLSLSTTSSRILYLVDPVLQKLRELQQVGISLPALAWLAVYDQNLQKQIRDTTRRLDDRLYCILVGLAYFYTSSFGARSAAASGGFTRRSCRQTCFSFIMPNQRTRAVPTSNAGRVPDAQIRP